MTPSVRYGNFGAEQRHLSIQRDYATNGEDILGGQEAWANRMGREIVYGLWNQLQLCNLDLEVDIDKDILQKISFKNKSGENVPLQPLPYHPVNDADAIALKRGNFEYLRRLCKLVNIPIQKHVYIEYQKRLREDDYDADKDQDTWSIEWRTRSSIPTSSTAFSGDVPPSDFSGNIVKILEHVRMGSQVIFISRFSYSPSVD
jgi:hypothetical protein